MPPVKMAATSSLAALRLAYESVLTSVKPRVPSASAAKSTSVFPP